ncbi:hypothetical protein ACVTD8_16860 [Vibrio cholerae]
MKNVQVNRDELKAFVSSLYSDGKKPCERFGLTWDSLSALEQEVPELTCRLPQHDCKTA